MAAPRPRTTELQSALHLLPPAARHLAPAGRRRRQAETAKFKRGPIGFFHMDIAGVLTAEGKLYLFVGIDRTSKFAVTQLVERADRRTAWEVLQHMLEAVPYHVHTILSYNGIQFAEQPRNRNTSISRPMRFDMNCEANDIEHRLTKPNHAWRSEDKETIRGIVFPRDGQVERMTRTIKDATVKRFHYDSHDQLRVHLADFMAADNFARRLKTLGGLTPYEYICKVRTSEPDRSILQPSHQMPGVNTEGQGPQTASVSAPSSVVSGSAGA